MHTLSLKTAPINRRGGQNSYLLLKKGQFGSQNLVVTWVDCAPGGEQQMHVHQAEEQAYIIVRGRGRCLAPHGRRCPHRLLRLQASDVNAM